MDSLDLLLSENELISLAFELWSANGDPTQRGMEAKFIIRDLAIREAARDDVVQALSSLHRSETAASFINCDRKPMRRAYVKPRE